MKYLDSIFTHKDWFVNGDISIRLALQYFAACGDFDFNGSRLRYNGRKGGVYNLSKIEQEYYSLLLEKKESALKRAEPIYKELLKKNEVIVLQESVYYIDEDMLIQLWYGMKYITVSFIEYLEGYCKSFCEDIKLEDLKKNVGRK